MQINCLFYEEKLKKAKKQNIGSIQLKNINK